VDLVGVTVLNGSYRKRSPMTERKAVLNSLVYYNKHTRHSQ